MIVLACGCISFGEAKSSHIGTSRAEAIFSKVGFNQVFYSMTHSINV